MPQTNTDIATLTAYLEKNEVDFDVDTNPTPEKISRIKASMKRKDSFIKAVREVYTLSLK